jgi:predicted PurR-regulated permease PerM
LATVGIVFVVATFILLQREDLRDRLIRLFGATDLHRTTSALDDAARRLSKYFLTQFGINATFGLVIGVGLFFIGVPNPVLWGMLSALLRFVPYIGSFIGAGLPIALAAAVDPGWSMVIWTAALYIVIELLVGQAVEPMMYGRGTGLSPLAVVVAAIFWSWLWGPIGLILSMPLTLCLVVLGRHVERSFSRCCWATARR